MFSHLTLQSKMFQHDTQALSESPQLRRAAGAAATAVSAAADTARGQFTYTSKTIGKVDTPIGSYKLNITNHKQDALRVMGLFVVLLGLRSGKLTRVSHADGERFAEILKPTKGRESKNSQARATETHP